MTRHVAKPSVLESLPRSGRDGFTLLEVVLTQLILLVLAAVVVPVYSQNMKLEHMLWERRQVLRVIDTELEGACNTAGVNFTDPTLNATPPFPFPGGTPMTWAVLPPELQNPVGRRSVRCLNDLLATAACPTDLKEIVARVEWTSEGRAVWEQSSPYLISKTGTCNMQP